MRPPLALFALLAVLALSAISCHSADAPRSSVSELFDPARRLRAFQQLMLRAKPDEALQKSWDRIDEFAEWHARVAVSRIVRKGQPSRVLVTSEGLKMEAWHSPQSASAGNDRPTVLRPAESVDYYVFENDGSLVKADRDWVHDGLAADLDGDGAVDLAEVRRLSMEPLALDGKSAATSGKNLVEWLEVKAPDFNSSPIFVVLYNFHPFDRAATNSWGFQFVEREGAGVYDLQLGPLTMTGNDAKVVFRWDTVRRTWVGPPAKPGDHFRVLDPGDADMEVERVREAGGLGYALYPVESPANPPPPDLADVDKLDRDLLSHPYRYRSLAALGDDALFDAMTRRRSAWDFAAELRRKATTVDDFWMREPKLAALGYVIRNRPPLTIAPELLSFEDDAGDVPEEGDLTLSDAPSGCFAPAGDYEHHLHCSRTGSFLLYAEIITPWVNHLPSDRRTYGDFRKLEVSYENAKRILQTVWWLSRIRSRAISEKNMEFMSGGSTSDGWATVQISAGKRSLCIDAARAAGHTGTWLGTGTMSSEYDESAFINLVVQLFHREIPARLGSVWDRRAPTQKWYQPGDSPEDNAGPDARTRLRSAAREILRLFLQGQLSPAAVRPAVEVAGEFGWRDFRGEIERGRAALPPLDPAETRLAAIDRELAKWRKKLGPEPVSWQAFWARRDARNPPPSPPEIPGLGSAPAPLAPKSPALTEDLRAVDSLHEERERIEKKRPATAKQLGRLRASISAALRKLEIFDDPTALEQWAHTEPEQLDFVCSRLAALDRPRALHLLDWVAARSENAGQRQFFVNAREVLEAQDAPPQPATDGQTEKLLAVLRDPMPEFGERRRALLTLIPPNDPMRLPDRAIDDTLLALLRAGPEQAGYLPAELSAAVARRLGPAAWEPLSAFTRTESRILENRFSEVLPGLALIAQKDPGTYADRLGGLLAPQFNESHGGLDEVFWSAWQADLRALKSALEEIATSSPDDAEGTRATGNSNRSAPVDQRFHLARQVVAIWNEEDALTSTKLLVAFALGNAPRFSDAYEGSFDRLREQLAVNVARVGEKDRARLEAFVQWCRQNAAAKLADKQSNGMTMKVLARIEAVVKSGR